MSPADDYRKNADECRELAAKASNPNDKAQWLKLVQEWLRMAQEAERRRGLF